MPRPDWSILGHCSEFFKLCGKVASDDFGGSLMRTPWTLSTIEALIFFGLVLVLAGAGTWATVLG